MPAIDGAGPLPKRNVHALPLFVFWYFVRRPVAIVRTWISFSAALQESFSLLFLLRTLLAPWKRILDPFPKNIFDVSALFEAIVFNAVTRAIGAIIRLVTLILGTVLLLLTAVLFLGYLLVWMVFPFFLVLGFVFLVSFL